MIRDVDRRIARILVALKIWRVREGLFRCPQLVPGKGTRWIWKWMRARQIPEDRPYHHAPACPANRWAGQALVLQPCTCGAVKRGILSRKS